MGVWVELPAKLKLARHDGDRRATMPSCQHAVVRSRARLFLRWQLRRIERSQICRTI